MNIGDLDNIEISNLSHLWDNSTPSIVVLSPKDGKIISHETILTEDALIISNTEIVKNF